MYVRYHHDVVGVNSRLDSIQAAVLNEKLPLLDSYGKARQNAARKYSLAFENNKNIIAPTICDNCDCHVFHQYIIRIINGKRDGLMDYLLVNEFRVQFIIQFRCTVKKHIWTQDIKKKIFQ